MSSGSSSGAPKYQKSMCASSGMLRIDSTYAKPSQRSGAKGDSRSSATTSAMGSASTSDAASSCSDSSRPATSMSWYLPVSSKE